jgi:hypothetical protein
MKEPRQPNKPIKPAKFEKPIIKSVAVYDGTTLADVIKLVGGADKTKVLFSQEQDQDDYSANCYFEYETAARPNPKYAEQMEEYERALVSYEQKMVAYEEALAKYKAAENEEALKIAKKTMKAAGYKWEEKQ